MKVSLWALVLGIGLVAPIIKAQVGFAQVESYSNSSIELAQAETKNTSREAEIERVNQLNQQGTDLYQQGKYAEAVSIFEQVFEIIKRLFPEGHPNIIVGLNNLAEIYRVQGKYVKAETLFQEALEISKEISPPEYSYVYISDILSNLGALYDSQGKYVKAETLFQEALKISKRLYPDDHPSVAVKLNNLADLYSSQGKYTKAEPLFQEALVIFRRFFSDDHLHVAVSLDNLGLLYAKQGRYTEAENSYQEARTILRRLFNDDHPQVALNLNNLATLYSALERYTEAESLLQEAVTVSKQIFSQDHPNTALSLHNLADLYRIQGRYVEAESLFQEALKMSERLFSNDHPYLAWNFDSLADLYRIRGRYVEAESLFQEALKMRKRFFSNDHPSVARSFRSIGLFYQAQAQYPEALNYLTKAAEVEEAILSENLVIGSEQQKKQFLDKFQGNTDTTISLHLTAIPKNRQAAELALTTILRRKGRVLDAMGQTLQTFRANLDDDSAQLLTDLTDKKSQLTNLAYKPLPNDPTQRKNVQTLQADLDQQIKTLEAKLSSRSAEFAQTTTPVTIAQVQQAIPKDAALAEFIQYRPYDAKERTYSEPRYAVYVLLPNGEMQWQDLGEAAPIDAQIKQFREMLGRGERGLGAQQKTFTVDDIKQAARELDKLLMQPVRAMTGDTTHLLLSPDSQLNTLPFAALVDESDNYLVENYLITYLTSGRDLLRLQLNQDQKPTEPLLFANPDYVKEGIASKENSDKRGRRSAELSSLNDFQPLPGTKVEGEAIATIVPKIKVYTEAAASENNLKDKQNQNPEFLHLATHGFFLSPEKIAETNQRDIGTIDNQPVFSTAENPLLRSGLALAGFNQRKSGTEDGVLTALEVTGLNLRGTKLVVLSACETGLGDVQAGEGVYGLRRAFTLAGAQSQLMSLWSVSDEGTKDLMVEYYSRIQNGEARGEALRQVQLEMLESEERNHPFYWAAFIPSGSWLPLD